MPEQNEPLKQYNPRFCRCHGYLVAQCPRFKIWISIIRYLREIEIRSLSMGVKAVLIIAILFSTHAKAEDTWTTEDTLRHSALTVLMAADYMQTINIAKNPDDYYERNPILGRHPSVGEVSAYFAVSYVAITAAAYLMPADWRQYLQYAVIGVEAAAVGNNLIIGVGFGF